MPSYSKWSSNGPIGQGLRDEIIKGDYICRGITAGEVWKNNEKDTDLTSALTLPSDDDDIDTQADVDSYHDAFSSFSSPSPKKKTVKKKKGSGDVRFSLKESISNDSAGSCYQEINHVKNKDVLLPHLLVHWKDAHLYNRCTLFVWCLSGLEPKDVNAKILKGGTTLCLRFAWPDPLQDALKLTRDAYCRDSSKVVEMETIFKQMKGGSSHSMITSEVEFDLGMQVEEEFHNEALPHGKVEKGNKLLRFFKTVYHNKMGKREKFPL